MKKIKTQKIELCKIKHIENSRLREHDDVSDLMSDIEQRGLLQPIGIRESDKALIFGNRRVKAFEKLGYSEIEADFYEDVSDEDLLITNLAENLKRKSIGSIEIGRICKILTNKGMTVSEISTKLAVTKSNVMSAISAYNVVVGTPFEKLVIYGSMGKNRTGIPQTLIWKIQNSLSRARKLSKDDWNILLRVLESGELTSEHISQLRKLLMCSPEMSMTKALDVLSKCRISHIWIHFNDSELNKAMRDMKVNSEADLIRQLIRNYNKDLLY